MSLCYVVTPISEKGAHVWLMSEVGRERFMSTGVPPLAVVGVFSALLEPHEAQLIARVVGRSQALEACTRPLPVYRAKAMFDPDWIYPWGRWSFRRRGRKDYHGLWSFSAIAERWVYENDRHFTKRLRVSPCFGCWNHHSRLHADVIIDAVDMDLIRAIPQAG